MRCAPIVSDTLLGGTPVFPACGVSRAARLVSQPIRPQYTPSSSCARAQVQVVVDAAGNPVPKTARVMRATDQNLATAMLSALPMLRYEPARKDDVPVAQIVNVEWAVTVQAVAAGMGPARRATRPRC